MRTTIRLSITLALIASLFVSFATAKQISLDKIPEIVIAAAKTAVPGLDILEAEKELEWGKVVFELTGVNSSDGYFYEVEVSAKGKVLEIEKRLEQSEGEEDDDDDDEPGEEESDD